MEKQMKCSHCGQVFTTIPDRNSFGEVCLCNTCLQQVPNQAYNNAYGTQNTYVQPSLTQQEYTESGLNIASDDLPFK